MKKHIGLLLPEQLKNIDLSHIFQHLQDQSVITIINENTSFINIFGVRFLDNIIYKNILLYNKLITTLFFIFTKKTFLNNFNLMTLFRLENEKNVFKKIIFYFLTKYNFSFFSYDFYLKFIIPIKVENVEKFDLILGFTEFSNDAKVKYLKNQDLNIFFYIYSWDHIYKYLRFSQNFIYLVWNNKLMDRLQSSFNIKNVLVTGTSQFDYILNQYNVPQNLKVHQKKYVYFCLSTGIQKLFECELKIVKDLSIFLKHHEIDLIVRPYPLFKGNYNELLNYNSDNLHFDVIDKETIINNQNKISRIKNSICVIHCGSTIGIESFLIGTPSFLFIDCSESYNSINLSNFALQQQNVDFYLNLASPFVIYGKNDLIKILDINKNDLKKTLSNFKNNFFEFNNTILSNLIEKNGKNY